MRDFRLLKGMVWDIEDSCFELFVHGDVNYAAQVVDRMNMIIERATIIKEIAERASINAVVHKKAVRAAKRAKRYDVENLPPDDPAVDDQ